MEVKYFKPLWAISWRRGRPVYVSPSKILVAHDFFTQALPVTGGPATCYLDPTQSVSKVCALPELGRIAQTQLSSGNRVLIDHYPEMSECPFLEQLKTAEIRDCLAMSFLGTKLLLLTEFKPTGYHFELWLYGQEALADSQSTPQFNSEVPVPDVYVHPLRWYQAALLSTARVIMLEVKEDYRLELSYYYIEDEDGKLTFCRSRDPKTGKSCTYEDKERSNACLKLECFCWAPENRMVLATSVGIFEAKLGDQSLLKLKDTGAAVVFMVQYSQNLYAAFETGLIEVVCTDQGKWDIIQALRVDCLSVAYACLSPDWRYLTVMTGKCNIVNLELTPRGLEKISEFPDLRMDEVVGVEILDPSQPHCVVAEKSGALHVIDETSGNVISTIRTEERISSMATNPQCSCVALGFSSGSLHFFDCTTPVKPRIVFCERPFDSPIQLLKFDNFGRFVVAATENNIVIGSAAPTSGFAKLGSLGLPFAIKDIAAFCQTAAGGTSIFVLTGNESGKGVLFKIQLPCDFLSSFKQYHKDSFGALSEYALGVESLELGGAFTTIDVHYDLGVMLHSSSSSTVQRLDPWTDMKNAKLEDLAALKFVHSWCLSLSQDLIVTARRIEPPQGSCTEVKERIELLSTANLTRKESLASLCISAEWPGRSYFKLPDFSNNLICGKKNGDILFCELTHRHPRPRRVPEWTVHCFSRTEAENDHLKSMDEDEPSNVIVPKEEAVPDSEWLKGRELNLLEACVAVTDFKLDQLDGPVSIDEHLRDFLENMDIVSKLLLFNRKNIFLAMSRDIPDDVKAGTDWWLEDDALSVSSLNAHVLVSAYSKKIIEKDMALADSLDDKISRNGYQENKGRRLSLSDVVKSKCKEDGLSAIKSLIRSICYSKCAFNVEFDALSEKRLEISKSVDESYMEAKAMSQSLPSKAERDFWSASVERSNVLYDTETNSKYGDSHQSSDPIAEAKKSIVDHLRSSSAIQKTFDSSVNDLRRLRRLTDFSIFGSEMKIYAILLFSAIEEDLSEQKKLLESSEKVLEASIIELREVELDDRRHLEDMKEIFWDVQRDERQLSKKLEDKCLKMNLSQQVLDQFKDQIEQGFNRFIRDQLSSPCLSLDAESIPLELKDFAERFECPRSVPKAVTDNFRNMQTSLLTLNILWWNMRRLLLYFAETKESVNDFHQRLRKAQKDVVEALELLTTLQSKFCAKIQPMLEMLKEASTVGEVGEAVTLKTLPAREHKMWKDVDDKTLRMLSAKQTLNEIDGLLGRIKELSKGIGAKSLCVEGDHRKFVENVKARLEEIKQAYDVANSVRVEHLEKPKLSALNFLKSAFKG